MAPNGRASTTAVRAVILAGLSACAAAPPRADGKVTVEVELVTSGPTAMRRGALRLSLDGDPWTSVEAAPARETDETRALPLDEAPHEVGVVAPVPCGASLDRCRYYVSASTRVRRTQSTASLRLEVVFGDAQLPPDKRIELRTGGEGIEVLGGTAPVVQRPTFDVGDVCALYCAAAPAVATTGPGRSDAVCRAAADLDARMTAYREAPLRGGEADGVDPAAREEWRRETSRTTAELVTVCKSPPGVDRDEAVRRAFTRLQLLLDTVL